MQICLAAELGQIAHVVHPVLLRTVIDQVPVASVIHVAVARRQQWGPVAVLLHQPRKTRVPRRIILSLAGIGFAAGAAPMQAERKEHRLTNLMPIPRTRSRKS